MIDWFYMQLDVDIIIFGGGIAGLWTLNRLCQQGYNALLLETNALGAGQTLKSQGIIHGGLKYALTGKLGNATQAISNLPQRWHDCLQGQGEMDLRHVNVLSEHQYFWTAPSISSHLTSFLASKALSSKCVKLKKNTYPEVFQDPTFTGAVYQLQETVLDVPSLLQALSQKYQNRILAIDADGYDLHYVNDHQLQTVTIKQQDEQLQLSAKHYVFAAGNHNMQLLQQQTPAVAMQQRPLHMIMLKQAQLPRLYAHCIGSNSNPLITISTHPTRDQQSVWYIGGQIAEDGINLDSQQQIQIAKKQLQRLIPWVNVQKAQWQSFYIDRAEAKQRHGKRPDNAVLKNIGNISIAWPTKLTFAPQLADAVLQSIDFAPHNSNIEVLANWPKAHVATPIWDDLFS